MAQDAIFYPDPQPQQVLRKVAPLTLTYGDQPPRKAALALTAALCIAAWNPPDPQPTQKHVQIAPLTLTYGDQPPRQRNNLNTSITIGQWVSTWDAQRSIKSLAWSPPLIVTFVPFARAWLSTVHQTWVPNPNAAQSAAANASWNVSAVVLPTIPFYRPWLTVVLMSWLPNPPMPQRTVPIQITDNTPPVTSALFWNRHRPGPLGR